MVWKARLWSLPSSFENVDLMFALGAPGAEIEEAMKADDDDIVVLDTIRLLGLKDEKDNAEIIRVLTPLIKACREGEKTSIFTHHTRKGGGEYGEAASGGHAFLGIVDIGLEVDRVYGVKNRRQVTGLGRIVDIPRLMYELQEDGAMAFLGDPQEVSLNNVKERVLAVLDSEWLATKEILAAVGNPSPSTDQLSLALNELAIDGKVERQPPFSEGPKPGKTYRWRNLTSDAPCGLVGSEV